MLLLLVELLDLLELDAVILKNDVELRVEVALQRLALEDRLERRQQPQAIFDGRDVLKTLVDEVLERAFQVRDLDLRGASYSLEAVRRLSCGRGDGVAVA